MILIHYYVLIMMHMLNMIFHFLSNFVLILIQYYDCRIIKSFQKLKIVTIDIE